MDVRNELGLMLMWASASSSDSALVISFLHSRYSKDAHSCNANEKQKHTHTVLTSLVFIGSISVTVDLVDEHIEANLGVDLCSDLHHRDEILDGLLVRFFILLKTHKFQRDSACRKDGVQKRRDART